MVCRPEGMEDFCELMNYNKKLDRRIWGALDRENRMIGGNYPHLVVARSDTTYNWWIEPDQPRQV